MPIWSKAQFSKTRYEEFRIVTAAGISSAAWVTYRFSLFQSLPSKPMFFTVSAGASSEPFMSVTVSMESVAEA